MKRRIALLTALMLLVGGTAIAQEKLQSKWVDGELQFYDSSTGTAALKVSPTAVDVVGTFKVGGTTMSATATELSKLAGVVAGTTTASKALVVGTNKNLDVLALPVSGLKIGSGAGTAVDATAAELNTLGSVVAGTASASKAAVLGTNKNLDTLVIADGGLKLGAGAGTAVTATAAELNLIDDSVAGTAVASKAAVLGADKNLDTLAIADGGLKLGAGAGTAVTSTAAELNILDGVTATTAELNEYCVTVTLTDAGTAASGFVVCPHAGTITAISVVNHTANADTKTVYTGKIGGVSITHAALETSITAAAGTVATVAPSADNVVTAGQAVEIASDGGTSTAMPATVTLTISR